MEKIYQNPFFQVIVLFIISSIVWYFLVDEDKNIRKKVLSIVSDGIYYFLLATLGLNFLSQPKAILNNPFQIILFSSQISWWAVIFVVLLFFFKYRKNILQKQEVVDSIIQYFLFLGITNHLFYYFKYQNLATVLFLLFYFVSYFLHTQLKSFWKNEWILVALGIFHAIILTLFGKVIIYYQIVFYRYQIIVLFLLVGSLLYLFRSEILSKRKSQV